jgi:hypothetical protein
MTINSRYGYLHEKLSAAVLMLMAPHHGGEAVSYASAFSACDLGLNFGWQFPRDELDRQAREWVKTIEEIMDTTGIEDPMERGTHLIKAERLTEEEKSRFSKAIYELSGWCDRHYYGIEC